MVKPTAHPGSREWRRQQPKKKMRLLKEPVFDAVGYEPHNGQQTIHGSKARHRVVSCGRRFGKSTAGGHEITPHALASYANKDYLDLERQRVRGWIVGPNYDDAEREFRVFYEDCKRLELPMDKPGTYYDVRGGNMQVSLWQGLFIVECRSAAHPESLDGEGLDFVVLSEAAKLRSNIWNKFIRPAIADKRGWSLWLTTPEGRNWFYDYWMRGQDENEKEWFSLRMPSWMNDHVFPDGKDDQEIAEMRADMSEELFSQEVEADFADFVGRVFKRFEEEHHVARVDYDPSLPLYAATDYGWTNPFVWLAIQVDRHDQVRVLGEYRAIHKDINDIAEDLKQWSLARNARLIYPEPASPGDTEVLRKALRCDVNTKTGGPLKDRLEMIRHSLKIRNLHGREEDQYPGLVIDRSCEGLIYEMGEYRYPERKSEMKAAPEEPLDKDDHGPEALGRFYRGYFGRLGESLDGGRSRAKVRRANVGR